MLEPAKQLPAKYAIVKKPVTYKIGVVVSLKEK